MSVLSSVPNARQERELEKVNAFYLQKEAEVSILLAYMDGLDNCVAQNSSQNIVRQEKSSSISSRRL
jgi:hypothetical protein